MLRKLKSVSSFLDASTGGGKRHHTMITWERDHVRACVAELGQGTAEILGLGAAPMHGVGPTSHPDVDRWVAGCDKAITQAEDMTVTTSDHKRVPDVVSMSVPAEITRRIPIRVQFSRRHASHPVAAEELEAVLQRGYRKAQDIVGTRGRNTDAEIVHGSVAEIRLDGQPVLDPIGLHGTELSLKMSFGLIPLEWSRTLEVIAERLELELAMVAPHDVVYAAPLSDPSALLVVVDEHHTTIDLVNSGRLAWAAHVGFGEREIVAGTARELGMEAHQADALMRVYRTGQLADEHEAQVAQAFWTQLCVWMDALSERVRGSLQGAHVPHHVYFLDATRNLPEAQQSLDTPYWEQSLQFDRAPETISLQVGMVRGVLDCTAQATGQAYLLLRSLAYYVASLCAPGRNLERALAAIVTRQRT